MADLEKSLFVPIVQPEKLNPHFQLLVDAPSYHPTRNMLELIYQDFDDPDGNFLQQFQTTGFDARFFELYLFAYFSNSGFEVDRSHPSPDFIVTRDGVTVAVEATTVNPSQGNLFAGQSLPSKLDPRELAHFQDEELPIRFGSPLLSKLTKKNRYWELEHCKGRPFILAIQAFFNEESLTPADSSLTQYLYGQRASAGWTTEGNLEVHTDIVESHTYGAKTINSIFLNNLIRNMSARLCSPTVGLMRSSRGWGIRRASGSNILMFLGRVTVVILTLKQWTLRISNIISLNLL